MRPAHFKLERAKTFGDALAQTDEGAVPLAGGQVVIPEIRLRRGVMPSRLVDLSSIEDAAGVDIVEDAMIIGAMTTAESLSGEGVRRVAPWLSQAAETLGDTQTRNRATIGGNIAWADPRANFLVALLAAQADLTIVRSHGEVLVPLVDTLAGFRHLDLQNGLITKIHVRDISALRASYHEESRQRHELALASACVAYRSNALTVCLGGIATRPVTIRADSVEDITTSTIFETLATERLEDLPGAYGPHAYRVELATVAARRALAKIAH